MSFQDRRLPLDFMRGADGGLGFKNTILVSDSGEEQRNDEWEQCRGEWDLRGHFMWIDDPEVLATDIRRMRQFFMPAKGSLHTFRVRDEVDFTLGDPSSPTTDNEQIGVGDTVETVFQTTLTYTDSGYPYIRDIHGIVDSSYTVLHDDVAINEGGGAGEYQIDLLTGVVTHTDPPGAGVSVQIAAFFDVICRFDIERLDIKLDQISQKSLIPEIPIIEEKNPVL